MTKKQTKNQPDKLQIWSKRLTTKQSQIKTNKSTQNPEARAEAQRQACLRWEGLGIRESEKGKLACDERGEKQRERSRAAEGFKGMVKLKILRIWVGLFVLICDCFVVNLLNQICSLSADFWFV